MGPAELGVGDRIQDWLARANREFRRSYGDCRRRHRVAQTPTTLLEARGSKERARGLRKPRPEANSESAKRKEYGRREPSAFGNASGDESSKVPKTKRSKVKKRKIAAAPPPRTATKIELGKSSSRRSRSREPSAQSVDAVRQPAPEVRGSLSGAYRRFGCWPRRPALDLAGGKQALPQPAVVSRCRGATRFAR